MAKKKVSHRFIKKRRTHESEQAEQLIGQYFDGLQEGNQPADYPFEHAHQLLFKRVKHTIGTHDRNLRIRRRWLLAAAAVVPFLLVSGLFLFNYTRPAPHEKTAAMLEKKALRGTVQKLVLADGTRVWLNAGSKLRFPEQFTDASRDVYLEGEAYFEVAADPRKVFTVSSNGIQTHVLGTSFNVAAYQGDPEVKVTVTSGKVGVSATANDDTRSAITYVMPNQQAVYGSAGQLLAFHENVDAQQAASWKNGKLIFRDTRLITVTNTLERRFDVEIGVHERIKNCIITADFSEQSLDNMLFVLAQLVNGKTERTNGNYILNGTGCLF